MALWLQVILAVVLVAVAGFLVPLLLQLRRTAAAVEQLAESARADLRQVAEDVHHLRNRADGLVDLAAASLELPMGITRLVSGTAQALETFLVKGGMPWMGALLTGVKFIVKFFRRSREGAGTKEASHE